MSLAVSISVRAETDLTLQYKWYLEKAGVGVAERFLAGFDLSVSKLAKRPGLGRPGSFGPETWLGFGHFLSAGVSEFSSFGIAMTEMC